MFDKAMYIAAREHLGVRDKGGHAYILHAMRITMRLRTTDEELMSIAILHDVIEDSKMTFEDLVCEGFSERVIVALKLLTHQHGVSYDCSYVEITPVSERIETDEEFTSRINDENIRQAELKRRELAQLEHLRLKYGL